MLIANYGGYAAFLLRRQQLVWQQALPFQLCDWAMVTVIVALLTRRERWSEVSYFWGIGGTLQAILTPNLPVGFPSVRFLSFFVGHCGIVVGVIYLLVARRFRPSLGSIWRTLAWSELYLVTTMLVDRLTNVNYGFLLHKPEAASILDYLSRTHWLYLLELNALALVFFALLYAPFAVRAPLPSAGQQRSLMHRIKRGEEGRGDGVDVHQAAFQDRRVARIGSRENMILGIGEDDIANNRALGSAAARVRVSFSEQSARDRDRSFADFVLRAGISRDRVHDFPGLGVHHYGVVA